MSTASPRRAFPFPTLARRLLPTFPRAGRPRFAPFDYPLSFFLFRWALSGSSTPLRPFDCPNFIPLPTVGPPNGTINPYVPRKALCVSNESLTLPVYEDGSPLNQDLNHAIFVMLILGGHVCFPFMLSCILISRNPLSSSVLFLHFCFTWILHSVGFSIL